MRSIAPTVAMLAAVALAWGGAWLWVKGRDRKRAVLMLVMAAVLVGNVLVWTV